MRPWAAVVLAIEDVMKPLRYGIVGGGFISAFHLRALRQVRSVEVAGLVSRRPPEALAAYVREHALGEGRVFNSIKEMAPHVDVIAIFAAFSPLDHVVEQRINDRHGDQREQERQRLSADHDARNVAVVAGADAPRQGKRHHAGHEGERRHQRYGEVRVQKENRDARILVDNQC